MPEYENDRQLVFQDFKNRLLDLSEMNLTLPATDIYDEPVRYYKANLQWTPIIEGFLDWLADIASWKDAQDENYPAIQQLLKYLEGVEVAVSIDCNEVENCITISPTIVNIQNNVTTIESEVTNVTNTVNNHTTEITNLTEEVTEIIENSTYNEYPPEPEPSEALDSYCGSSWSIANYLNDFIQQVITDAQTITLQEFFTAILGLGGFKTSIVKVLWDYIIASINPNLSTEVSDALPYVAEAFYCNFLNPDSAKADIIANTNITSDAEATFVSAIDALTIAKFSELIFLGSLNESEDCSSFSCGCGEYDFTKSLHGFTIINGIYEGALGVKRDGTGQAIIQLTGMPKTFRIDRWEMDYVMNAPSGVKGAQVRVTDATTGVTQSSGGNPIADGTLRTTGAFLGDPNSNGLRFTLFNTGGLCWIKKVRIYYTRETGAPQNSAPTC